MSQMPNHRNSLEAQTISFFPSHSCFHIFQACSGTLRAQLLLISHQPSPYVIIHSMMRPPGTWDRPSPRNVPFISYLCLLSSHSCSFCLPPLCNMYTTTCSVQTQRSSGHLENIRLFFEVNFIWVQRSQNSCFRRTEMARLPQICKNVTSALKRNRHISDPFWLFSALTLYCNIVL